MKKLAVLTLFLMFSCKKESPVPQNTEAKDSVELRTDSVSAAQQISPELKLEKFGFPPEVEGCSCYFAANMEDFEDEKYIYIDDYGNNAYVKVEGNLIKIEMKEGDFDPENFNKTLKNDDIKITITGKKIKELEEVMMFEGTMTVEKNGRKITTPIYGECGC